MAKSFTEQELCDIKYMKKLGFMTIEDHNKIEGEQSQCQKKTKS